MNKILKMTQIEQYFISCNYQMQRTQQNNNFNMDYNQFTYYRANPYAKNGFMPPTAFLNRHKPEFLTQLPMGEQHLSKGGKKQYSINVHKSNIQTQALLKSPQRYPYQNRIALDKQYQRNLNTIDIEGASGGTLLSQAVRNKMKARQLLTRKQELQNMQRIQRNQPWKNTDLNQEQKRRKIAYTQYLRDQQTKQLQESQKSNKKISSSKQIPQFNHNAHNAQQTNNNQYYLPTNRNNVQQMQANSNELIQQRYQSIDAASLRQRQRQKQLQQIGSQPKMYQNSRDYLQNMNVKLDVSHRRFKHEKFSEDAKIPDSQEHEHEKQTPNTQLLYANLAKDRKSLRYQNPTNLSSDSSIHIAARNIIKGE